MIISLLGFPSTSSLASATDLGNGINYHSDIVLFNGLFQETTFYSSSNNLLKNKQNKIRLNDRTSLYQYKTNQEELTNKNSVKTEETILAQASDQPVDLDDDLLDIKPGIDQQAPNNRPAINQADEIEKLPSNDYFDLLEDNFEQEDLPENPNSNSLGNSFENPNQIEELPNFNEDNFDLDPEDKKIIPRRNIVPEPVLDEIIPDEYYNDYPIRQNPNTNNELDNKDKKSLPKEKKVRYKSTSYYFRGAKEEEDTDITDSKSEDQYFGIVSVGTLFYYPESFGFNLAVGYESLIESFDVYSYTDLGSFNIYYDLLAQYSQVSFYDNLDAIKHVEAGLSVKFKFLYRSIIAVGIGPVLGLEANGCSINETWYFCFAPLMGIELSIYDTLLISYDYKLPFIIADGTLNQFYSIAHTFSIGFKL